LAGIGWRGYDAADVGGFASFEFSQFELTL
jgi:hypothetical protein